MADIPPFLQVPGAPGGRVAMSALSPELQQSLLSQYGPQTSPTEDAGPLLNRSVGEPAAEAFYTDPVYGRRRREDIGPTPNGPQPDVGTPSPYPDIRFGPSAATKAKLAAEDPGRFAAEVNGGAPGSPPVGSSPASPVPSAAGPSGGPMGALTQASMGMSARIPGAGSPSGPGYGGGDGQLRNAFEHKSKADEAAAEAGRASAIQAAAAQDEYAKQQQASAANAAQQEADRKKYMEEQVTKIKQAQAELQKPGQPIDADRVWKNKSTGQKVLAGVAVFLSGLGAGLQGRGGNQALEMIQKNIDDDISLQKESAANERQRKQEALSGQVNVFQLMREKGMDDRQAEAATRVMSAQAIDTKLKSLEAKSKVDSYTAGIQQLRAGNELNLQKSLEELHNNSAQRFAQEATGQAALMNAQTNRLEVGIKAATKNGGHAIPAELAAQLGQKEGVVKDINDLEKAFKTKASWHSFMSRYVPGSESARYEDQVNAVADTLAKALSDGRPSPELIDRIRGLLPTSLTGGGRASNQFNVLRALVMNKRDSELGGVRSAGYDTSGFAESPQSRRQKYGAVEQ